MASIRKLFADRSARKAEGKLFASKLAVVTDAVRTGDNKTFAAVFPAVKDSALFEDYKARNLLLEALNKDNVLVFNAILSTFEDKNISFNRTVWSGGYRAGNPVIIETEHILGLALRTGSENVALALIRNKQVAVDKSGQSEFYAAAFTPATITPFATPLELAREKGLKRAEASLIRRLAAPKQQPRP